MIDDASQGPATTFDKDSTDWGMDYRNWQACPLFQWLSKAIQWIEIPKLCVVHLPKSVLGLVQHHQYRGPQHPVGHIRLQV